MKLPVILPSLALSLVVAGCASGQKVGGQYLPVELRVEPPASRAYLVPSTRWREELKDRPAQAAKEYEKYAVDPAGPVNRRVVDMPYVFMAEWEDGSRRAIEVDPAPNTANAFILRPQ